MTHGVSPSYLAQHLKEDGERGVARMFQKLLCNLPPTFLQGHARLKHVARLSFNAVTIIPSGCEGIGWGGEGCYPHSVNVW